MIMSFAIKSVDVTNALPAQTLTYTITITNSGNVTIEDLFVVDTVPVDTAFVTSSVTINGINQPNENRKRHYIRKPCS